MTPPENLSQYAFLSFEINKFCYGPPVFPRNPLNCTKFFWKPVNLLEYASYFQKAVHASDYRTMLTVNRCVVFFKPR